MANNSQTPTPPFETSESITEVEVSADGTLCIANYAEAENRADFYYDVADSWSGSPEELLEAMEECQPLAWAVHSIYADLRDEVEAKLNGAQVESDGQGLHLANLEAQLDALPEEPEEGASAWLLNLTITQFEDVVVTEIEKWFGEPPDWSFEDDYLPESGTAQGAALELFRDMESDELAALGVEVIEGEHPGSTYYAAQLIGGIDEANRAAEAGGIPVRFVAVRD